MKYDDSTEHPGEFGITVTRSAGTDGAVVVFIDGDFTEAGLRVMVNDHTVHADPDYAGDHNDLAGREAKDVEVAFTLDDIAYVHDPEQEA